MQPAKRVSCALWAAILLIVSFGMSGCSKDTAFRPIVDISPIRSLVVDGIVNDLTGIPYGKVVRDIRIGLGEPSRLGGPEDIQTIMLEPPEEVAGFWSLVVISLYSTHEDAVSALRWVRRYPLVEDRVEKEAYFISYAVQHHSEFGLPLRHWSCEVRFVKGNVWVQIMCHLSGEDDDSLDRLVKFVCGVLGEFLSEQD